MNSEVILNLLALAAKYGIPAIQELIKEWKDDKPITVADVRNMEARFRDPSSYFEG